VGVVSLFTSAAPGVAQTRTSQVQAWLTDLGTANRLAPQPGLAFGSGGNADASTIAIDERRTYQSMVGFGASITDSSATVIAGLAPGPRAALMSDLFDPANGIGLDMLRQPMGASDFSASGNYSYDDMPPGG